MSLAHLLFRAAGPASLLLTVSAVSAAQQTTTTNCTATDYNLNCVSTRFPTQPDPNSQLLKLGLANLQAAAARRAALEAANAAAAAQVAQQAAEVARQNYDLTNTKLQELRSHYQASQPSIAPVNSDLHPDWSILNGVRVRYELKSDNNIRRNMLDEVAIVATPDGGSYVSITSSAEVKYTKIFTSSQLANEEFTAQLDPRTNATLIVTQRQPLLATVAPAYESIILMGDRAFAATMGGSSEGSVPPGILEEDLLTYAIAAYPGRLPDSARIWILNPTTGQVLPADIRIDGQQLRGVPIAAPGEVCGTDSEADVEQKSVVQVTVQAGTEIQRRQFLADAPHLPVYDDLRCISTLTPLPGDSTRTMPRRVEKGTQANPFQ